MPLWRPILGLWLRCFSFCVVYPCRAARRVLERILARLRGPPGGVPGADFFWRFFAARFPVLNFPPKKFRFRLQNLPWAYRFSKNRKFKMTFALFFRECVRACGFFLPPAFPGDGSRGAFGPQGNSIASCKKPRHGRHESRRPRRAIRTRHADGRGHRVRGPASGAASL